MLMANKNKDNIILFPKIPKQPPNAKAQELDAKRQEMIRLEHNKVFVQSVSEDLTETMLLRLKLPLSGSTNGLPDKITKDDVSPL